MTPTSADPIGTPPCRRTRPLMSGCIARSARSADAVRSRHRLRHRVSDPIVLSTRGLSVWYGSSLAIKEITIDIPRNKITALIGPSGCGKSTLLRCFNRMNDLITGRAHARARSGSTAT